MLGGFGLIGLVIAYWMLASKRDQRRQELAAEMALTASVSARDTLAAEPPRPKAGWEVDAALEEAPIGTVEYRPLEDGRGIGTLPENMREPEGPLLRRS
jgi:hypothetical protein